MKIDRRSGEDATFSLATAFGAAAIAVLTGARGLVGALFGVAGLFGAGLDDSGVFCSGGTLLAVEGSETSDDAAGFAGFGGFVSARVDDAGAGLDLGTVRFFAGISLAIVTFKEGSDLPLCFKRTAERRFPLRIVVLPFAIVNVGKHVMTERCELRSGRNLEPSFREFNGIVEASTLVEVELCEKKITLGEARIQRD
jgi:hypothetical protein